MVFQQFRAAVALSLLPHVCRVPIAVAISFATRPNDCATLPRKLTTKQPFRPILIDFTVCSAPRTTSNTFQLHHNNANGNLAVPVVAAKLTD